MPDENVILPTPPTPDPLAAALGRMLPRPPAIDRDSLMYDAGRASQEPALVFWKRLAIGCALLLLPLAVVTGVAVTRPDPAPRIEVVEVEKVVERIVEVPAPVPVAPPPRTSSEDAPPTATPYRRPEPELLANHRDDPLTAYRLRQSALARGLDAIPTRRIPTSSVITASDLPENYR